MNNKKTFSLNELGLSLLLGLVLMYMLAYLWMFIAKGVIFKGQPLVDSDLYIWISTLLTQGSILAAVCIICKVKKTSILEVANFRRGLTRKQFWLIIPISVVSIIAFAPLANLFLQILTELGYSFSGGAMPDYSSNFGLYILGVLCMCMLPAICEESMFRGAFVSGTKGYGYIFSIVLTGLAFGVFHGNAVQLIHQAFVGMIWAFMALASRSIWASAEAHFLNNFISVTITAIANSVMEHIKPNIGFGFVLSGISDDALDEAMSAMELSVGSALITLATTLIGCALLFLLLKAFSKQCVLRKEKETGTSFLDFKRALASNSTPIKLVDDEDNFFNANDGVSDAQVNLSNATDVGQKATAESATEQAQQPDLFQENIPGYAKKQAQQARYTIDNVQGPLENVPGYTSLQEKYNPFNEVGTGIPPLNAKQRFNRMMLYLRQDEDDTAPQKNEKPIVFIAALSVIAVLWFVDLIMGFVG